MPQVAKTGMMTEIEKEIIRQIVKEVSSEIVCETIRTAMEDPEKREEIKRILGNATSNPKYI